MEATNFVSSPIGNVPDAELDNEAQSSLDDNYLKLYGFNFSETYRHALRFYKGIKIIRVYKVTKKLI